MTIPPLRRVLGHELRGRHWYERLECGHERYLCRHDQSRPVRRRCEHCQREAERRGRLMTGGVQP